MSAKKEGKTQFFLGDIFELNPHGKSDLVLLIDVLEHIENHFDFLKKVRGLSRYHIFHIPLDMNALAVARDFPITDSRVNQGHLHYFSKNTALMTIKESGYNIIDFFFTPGAIEIPGGSLKHRLFKYFRKAA